MLLETSSKNRENSSMNYPLNASPESQLSVLDEPNRPNPFLAVSITDSDINQANETNIPLIDDDLDRD